MSATMTAPRSRSQPKHSMPSGPVTSYEPPTETDLFSEPSPGKTAHNITAVDMTPSQKLRNECVGVRLNFNWFSTSRQVDKVTKQHMADAANSNEDGFSASKRLMDSKHPTIKEASEVQRRIKGYFHSMTIPLAGFASGRGKPEPGVRLLSLRAVEEFEARMNTFVPEVKAMEEKLNKALPDIKAMDAKRLGGVFRAEDYPPSLSIDFSWGFVSVDVPAAMEKLAPKVYQKELDKLQDRMEETYELATMTVLEQFLDVVKDWTEVLGPVTRIYPVETSKYAEYHSAEIRRKLEPGDHELRLTAAGVITKTNVSIPAGNCGLVIRHYVGEDRKLTEKYIGPLTQSEYADLQPSQVSNEKRTFKATTIEGMTNFLSQFRNVGGTISASENLKSLVKTVESQLAKLGDVDTVAKELRTSVSFRNDTHKLMTQLSDNLSKEIEIFRVGRRKIDRGLIKAK